MKSRFNGDEHHVIFIVFFTFWMCRSILCARDMCFNIYMVRVLREEERSDQRKKDIEVMTST